MWISTLTLACLLVPTAAPVLASPANAVPATLPAQDRAARKATAVDLDEARRRLAEIELLITVDRDLAAAQTALADATARWQAETPALLAEPEVVAARLRIERLLDDATRQDTGALADAVREALMQANKNELRDIGPAGADLVLNALDSGQGLVAGREFDVDRLVWGGTILDADRLLEHLFERWRSGKGSSAQQVLDVLVFLLGDDENSPWSVVPGYEPKLRDPEWLDMFVQALADPAVVASGRSMADIEQITGALSDMDAFTPESGVSLAEFILKVPSNNASRLVSRLAATSHSYVPTVQPILERLLGEARSDMRQRVAVLLTRYPSSDALLALADDPDPAIRLSVIAALATRSVKRRVWMRRDPDQGEWRSDVVAPDPVRAATILTGLATDPEPVVREAVPAAIGGRDLPIDPEVFRRLARDPDPGVRSVLAANPPHDAALRVEVMTELARDADIVVTMAVDRWLYTAVRADEPGALLPVFRARLLEASVSVDDSGFTTADNLLEQLGASQEGRLALARWTLDTGTLRFLRAALPPSWARFNGVREREELFAPWLELPPADVVAVLRALEAIAPEAGRSFGGSLARHLPVLTDSHIATFSAALSDDTLSVGARCSLASVVATRSNDADVAALLGFLRDPEVLAQASESWMSNQLEAIGGSVPAGLRNPFLLTVLRESALPDASAQKLASRYRSDTPEAEPLILEIVRRWLDDPDEVQAVGRAVGDLAIVASPEAAEWLLRASEHPAYVREALEAMGRRRNPEFLPRLEECLSADWLGSSAPFSSEEVQSFAVDAIANYMNEQAAEALLRGSAKVFDAGVRAQCLARATMIRQFLDELEDWNRRKASRTTRETAITELLPMLDDPAWEVRLQAARALGTLGAVEHMPKLIALLRDRDESVREAAQSALDRLNAQVMPAPPADPASPQSEPTPANEHPPDDG